MSMYHPVPLHIHSIWERHASMEGHFYNAQKLGIKHMYITDHDIRMGRRKNHIDSFDFSKGVLRIDEPSPDPLRPVCHGFSITRTDEGTSVYMTENNQLCVKAVSSSYKWVTASTTFDTSQKRHEVALLANVVLHLGMKVSAMDNDTRVVVEIKLSQRPPEFKYGHILYVFGNTDDLENEYSSVKPLKQTGDFHKYVLPLLKDAALVGGGDNVLNTITFSVSSRNGKTAELLLNHLEIKWNENIAFENARKAQQKLADTIGKKYDITPIVTTEISAAGPHKICFSTSVPIIDYRVQNYCVSEEYAIEHVIKHSGIFACNHPYEGLKDAVTKYNGNKEELQKNYIKNIDRNIYRAATMMEVGFPEGRGGFTLEDHLFLWDTLSLEGIFITAYGDSDNHTNNTSWFDGNNFVAYIYAKNPDEKSFITSMKAGNLYTGDPVYLQNVNINFRDTDGYVMGNVVYSDKTNNALLDIKGIHTQYKVVWTVNGKTVKTENCTGDYSGFVPVPPTEKVNFVRVAVYKDDRCILLTNPIYYTSDKTIAEGVCKERRRQIDKRLV